MSLPIVPGIGPTLYAVRECSDVFVDAAVRDETGELLFMSLYGRDTAVLQLFASFTLPTSQGGRTALTLMCEDGGRTVTQKVSVTRASRIEKMTGNLPKNLFGRLLHIWLYDSEAIRPDQSNRSALLLRFDETMEQFADRVWLVIKQLSPVAMLDHWRYPLLHAIGRDLIRPLADSSAAPIGVVDGCRVMLGENFERVISFSVALGALTLSASDAPDNAVERIRQAALWAYSPEYADSEPAAKPEPEPDGNVVEPGATTAPLFELGKLMITPGAQEALAFDPRKPLKLLARHRSGDWGTCSPEDCRSNDRAVKQGSRVFSAYPIDDAKASAGHGDNTLWVITEADRSVTTILLPSEY